MKCLVCGHEYENRDACPRCGQSSDTEPNRAWHLKPGTVIKNKYVLGKSVGSGGFGVTYFAWDKALNRQVAIKEYMPSEFATRAFGQRSISIYGGDKREQYDSGLKKYVDEARRLAQLNKIDGIAQIYDYFEENATGYIVMEYVPGITFSKYLEENGGKISYEKAITLMLPIMAALEEVHKHDIIHRDISPDNILITPDEDVKLIDFGASRYATTAHSKSLSVILKPGYAPEEQYRSKGEQGPWSDVYAVGATLYRAITGIVPEDSMERKANDILKPIEKFRKLKVPQNISTAIMNALVSNHEYRYQNMAEFSDDLISDAKVAKIVAPKEAESGFHIPKKLRITLIAALFTSVALAGFFIARSFFRDEEAIVLSSNYTAAEINAPDLVGQSIESAENIAKYLDISIVATEMRNSDSVAADSVMIQTPLSGTIIYTQTTLEVIVSKGPVKYSMPDVCFSYLTDAETVLKELEFRINTIEVSSDYAPGTVIEQEYEPNTLVDRLEKIDLNVSLGIEDMVIGEDTKAPKVEGMMYEDGRQKCLEYNLYLVQTSQVWSDTVPKGEIISQSVTKNTEMKTGDVIEVEVSKGIEQVQIPDVRIQYTEEEAIQIIEDGKLSAKVVYESSESVIEGYVISQDIEPQKYVDKNSEITIVVSTGATWTYYALELPEEVINNPEKYEVVESLQYSHSDYTWKAGDWTKWYDTEQSGDYASSQTQYRIQSKEYTWSTSTSLSGWTKTGDERGSGTYTSWSSFSSWSTSNPGSETATWDVETKKQYNYGRIRHSGSTVYHFCPKQIELQGWSVTGYSSTGWVDSNVSVSSYYSYGYLANYSHSIDGVGFYASTGTKGAKYSYGGQTYYHKYSRTLYQYRTRDEIPEYQYYQWSDWTSWESGSGPAATSETQVQKQYRYQKKDYYWTNYSSWSNDRVTESDTRKVKTQTVYSYRIIVGK